MKFVVRASNLCISWEQRKLSEVVTEIKRTDEKSDAPVMMITAENGFINQSERYSTNNAGQSLKKYILLEKGELAYNHGASKLRPYGSCFALTTEEKARIPFVYHCFSTETENSEFLSIVLNGKAVEKQLRRIVSSGARMDGLLNISFDEYTSIPVMLPRKDEQDRIAEYFKNLDHLITLHQSKAESWKNKKNQLSSISWEQRKLGDVLETVTDYVAAGSFADLAKNVEYHDKPDYAQLVRTMDLKNGFTSSQEVFVDENAFNYLYRVNLDKECIILPNIGNCGEVYYVRPEALPYKHNVLGPNAILVRSETNSNLFLSTLFQAKDFQTKLSLIVSPNGQTKFNKTELKQIELLLPNSEKEQNKIGEYFANLDNLITLHQRKENNY